MSFKILDHIGTSFGNIKVDNEYFLDQVDEEHKASLLHYYNDISGKDIRYIADENQTSKSLACEAAQQALTENQISGEMIDMVMCITHTPEYFSPTMARYVVEAINGREDIRYFDMNQNCTGMLVAIDLADQCFKANENMQYILIVQGDCQSRTIVEKDSPFFGIFGDVGCAIILKRDTVSGIKERNFKILKEGLNSIVYPKDGFSKPSSPIYTQPNLDPGVHIGIEVIKDKVTAEELEKVKAFFISQFAYKNYLEFSRLMNVPMEKMPYVGNKYGYTGASSPILALKQGIEDGLIKRGDLIVLWTYGAGIQHAMIEMIY